MRAPKALHLLVCAPTQFVGNVHAALVIGGPIGCVQRNSDRSGIADDRNPALSRLKLFLGMYVDPVHGHALGGALFVLDSLGMWIANQAACSSRDLGNVLLAEVVD